MEDYLLAVGVLALLAGAVLALWRWRGGRARSVVRAGGRLTVALLLALVVAAAGTYALTKSRTFQLAGDLVSRVDASEKIVALTFDDGPTQEHTQEALDILDAAGIKATFYPTGAECEENPAMLRAIVDAGHELGNHTYSHRRMYFLPTAAVADEIERTDALFRAARYDATPTFRPPGCKRLLTTPLYLARNDRTTVTWDLEPDSIAEIADDAEAMTDYVMDNARPGSIVLMHVMYDARGASREALPHIIEELDAEGYRFVTVSELLALQE